MQITLNGQPMTLACAAHRLLLDLLRDDLGLTGTKEGCGTGDCGAWTALLNGNLVPTGLLLAGALAGADLVPIAGLRRGPARHPRQRASLDAGGAQCGDGTPGMLMLSKALLDEHPDPPEADIRFALAGNWCR